MVCLGFHVYLIFVKIVLSLSIVIILALIYIYIYIYEIQWTCVGVVPMVTRSASTNSETHYYAYFSLLYFAQFLLWNEAIDIQEVQVIEELTSGGWLRTALSCYWVAKTTFASVFLCWASRWKLIGIDEDDWRSVTLPPDISVLLAIDNKKQ